MSSIKLDVAIAKEIFGKKIIGRATCAKPPDDGWSVYPDTDPDQWQCWAEVRPVYIKDVCICKKLREKAKKNQTHDDKFWNRAWLQDKKDGRLFKGHFSVCLAVVPPYTADFCEAMGLVHVVGAESFVLRHDRGRWEAIFSSHGPIVGIGTSDPCGKDEHHGGASYAIAKAALLYRRDSRKSQKR